MKKCCIEKIVDVLDEIYVVGDPEQTYLKLAKKISLLLSLIQREN